MEIVQKKERELNYKVRHKKNMKNITIDNKTITISDESYNAFKEQFINKDARWIPKLNERYFYVNGYGDFSWLHWNNDEIDLFHLGQGNVFKTRKEVEKHVKKLHAISDVTNYCYENDLVLDCDWSDGEQNKLYIYYSYESKLFKSEYLWNIQCLDILPLLKSEEACKQVIKEKEKELKLIFGV